MLREILELNRRAAEQGEFEVAYHLLMAALHFADHARDLGVLDELGRLGRAQAEALERLQPPHPLSRQEARQRGHPSVFDSFAAHVKAVRLRVLSDEHRARRPS
jgi:hypothetical protein